MCKQLKPLGDFHRRTASRDGRQSRCRECNIAAQIKFHADNPQLCRQRISERGYRLRDRNRGLLVLYRREHPCVDCGESDPVVLEFDHVRGTKVANVSTLALRLKRWDTILEEIAKCDVVCANCHRRRTGQPANSFRMRAAQRINL